MIKETIFEDFYLPITYRYCKLITGPGSSDNIDYCRLTMFSKATGELVRLVDYKVLVDRLRIHTFKLVPGTYFLYARFRELPEMRYPYGQFTISRDNTSDNPFCLNSFSDVSAFFGYDGCEI